MSSSYRWTWLPGKTHFWNGLLCVECVH